MCATIPIVCDIKLRMKATLCTLTDGTQEHGEIHDVNGDPSLAVPLLVLSICEMRGLLIGQERLILTVIVHDVTLHFVLHFALNL